MRLRKDAVLVYTLRNRKPDQDDPTRCTDLDLCCLPSQRPSPRFWWLSECEGPNKSGRKEGKPGVCFIAR